MKFNFSSFPFLHQVFGVVSKKYLPNLRVQRFCPNFSTENVSFWLTFRKCHFSTENIRVRFTFRSAINFQLTFAYGVRHRSNLCICLFACLAYACPIIPAPFVDYPFSAELPLQFCQKSIHHVCVDLFLNSLSCFTDIFVYFCVNNTLSYLV